MLEPHNSISSPQHDHKRDVLLATKIGIPRIRTDLLPRSHLIGHLEDATSCDVVLVSTPAGFGKTTLLASWAQRTQRPLTWLSLDPDDNDPGRFWRSIVAAVDWVHNGFGEQASPCSTPRHNQPSRRSSPRCSTSSRPVQWSSCLSSTITT